MRYVIFGCLLCVLGVAAWMHETPQERLLSQQNFPSSKDTDTALFQSNGINWVDAAIANKYIQTTPPKSKTDNSLIRFVSETVLAQDSSFLIEEQAQSND